MEVLVYLLVFYAGIFIGMTFRSWLYNRSKYHGSIFVTKNPDKTIYSLELDDDPELIQFKKKVVLKVRPAPQIPDRD